MSNERIDVLAVLDAEIARSSNLPTAADPYVIERRHAMVDARAAVAELIEALAMVDRIWSGDQTANIDPESPLAKVRGALTKVGAR